jgi:pimeloyl-ACP methyl ester carboxylesterase
MKIILLPGLDGTGVLFKPFLDALPNNTVSLVIDYPVNEKLSYPELVEYVIGQLPDERFVLVGESFSGPIAYQIALLKPDKVASVIFVATFLSNPRKFLLKLSSFLPISLLLSIPIPTLIIKSLLLGYSANTKLINLFRQSLKYVSPYVLSFRLQEIAKLTNRHQLCGINSIYIQATDDALVPNNCVKEFRAMFNNLRIFKVKGPHFIMQASPVACAEIVANEIRLINV